MRQLGEVMENIEHNDTHEIIESAVLSGSGKLTEATLMGELNPTKGTNDELIINFNNENVVTMGGFLLVLNKELTELIAIHAIVNANSFTTLAKENHEELYNLYILSGVSDAFVQKLKDSYDHQNGSVNGELICNYIEGQRYHLYGFTA